MEYYITSNRLKNVALSKAGAKVNKDFKPTNIFYRKNEIFFQLKLNALINRDVIFKY